MLSFQGGIRVPSYTASKSAVMGVTRLLANEWAKHNINVNAIAPGYMATNNTQQLRADEQRSSEILDRIPAGRWGLPADLMGPVVFLASSASDYINGYTVAVDGALTVRDGRGLWYRSGLLSNYCPYAKVRIVHTPEHRYNVTALYKQGY